MNQLLNTLVIFSSVVSPVFGGVISIEAVNQNAIVVNYESSGQSNKSKVECVLRDEIGDIVGIGMTKLDNTISKVIVGISRGDMGKIVDIQCQEK
tara:strand:- start:21 stop:305 length:285 start_codon:yes stop_codon:yes gene_type:complete